ncbi:DM13 domain-containing protein [Coralliovum pocilloporae]|uniref:DM13 domain-containing protein n=1 Tax=Coralliovum pocilloporae TaxID=3066369 RepID=UPI003307B44F
MFFKLVSRIATGLVFAAGLALAATSVQAGGAKHGNFTGKSDHITTGKVEVKKEGGYYVVKLGKDFSLDGAPDPWVGLGKNGKYGAEIAVLKNKDGAQTYKIKADKAGDFNEVYIWCKKFTVPLGVAKLHK